ncbi:MAG: hypothetical protein J7513_13780 [Solirubrobacteraceae bacterium]|nr:hypothetical protein [Solirubrobacteraceae bacterium]
MRFAPPVAVTRLALVVACVGAIGLSACGSDETDRPAATSATVAPTTPTPTMSAERKRDAVRVAKALRAGRKTISGSIGEEYVANVECQAAPEGADDYDCSFILDSMEPSSFRMRLQDDGTVTKVLANRPPVKGMTTAANVADLLTADDKLQGAPARTRDWSCSRSPRMEPDGTFASSGAGYVCTTFLRVDRTERRRYVEFGPDGTARRDYTFPSD